MKKTVPITIVQDTREQLPLDFSPFEAVSVEVGKCYPGDYTVKGYEKSIAFERKSVSDLIGTLMNGYVGMESIRRYESRFDLELEHFARFFNRAVIVVEPDNAEVIRRCGGVPGCCAGEQIARHWYQSALPPGNVFKFLRSLRIKYRCDVFLALSREDAANEIVECARMYVDARRQVIHRGKVGKEEAEKAKPPPKTDEEPW